MEYMWNRIAIPHGIVISCFSSIYGEEYLFQWNVYSSHLWNKNSLSNVKNSNSLIVNLYVLLFYPQLKIKIIVFFFATKSN